MTNRPFKHTEKRHIEVAGTEYEIEATWLIEYDNGGNDYASGWTAEVVEVKILESVTAEIEAEIKNAVELMEPDWEKMGEKDE